VRSEEYLNLQHRELLSTDLGLCQSLASPLSDSGAKADTADKGRGGEDARHETRRKRGSGS